MDAIRRYVITLTAAAMLCALVKAAFSFWPLP